MAGLVCGQRARVSPSRHGGRRRSVPAADVAASEQSGWHVRGSVSRGWIASHTRGRSARRGFRRCEQRRMRGYSGAERGRTALAADQPLQERKPPRLVQADGDEEQQAGDWSTGDSANGEGRADGGSAQRRKLSLAERSQVALWAGRE